MASTAIAQNDPEITPIDAPAVSKALAELEAAFVEIDWNVTVFEITELDGGIHLASVQFASPDWLSASFTLNDALLKDVQLEGDSIKIGTLTARTLFMSFDDIPMAFNGSEDVLQNRLWQIDDIAATNVTLAIPPLPRFLTSAGQLPAGTGPHSELSDRYAPFPAALTYAFMGGIAADEIKARKATFETQFGDRRGRHLIDALHIADMQPDKIGLIAAERWRTNSMLLPRGLIQHDVQMRDVTINP